MVTNELRNFILMHKNKIIRTYTKDNDVCYMCTQMPNCRDCVIQQYILMDSRQIGNCTIAYGNLISTIAIMFPEDLFDIML